MKYKLTPDEDPYFKYSPDQPRDYHGRFGSGSDSTSGPRNPHRDSSIRQDYANGITIPQLISTHSLSHTRIMRILREAPIPPATVTLPPGTVIAPITPARTTPPVPRTPRPTTVEPVAPDTPVVPDKRPARDIRQKFTELISDATKPAPNPEFEKIDKRISELVELHASLSSKIGDAARRSEDISGMSRELQNIHSTMAEQIKLKTETSSGISRKRVVNVDEARRLIVKAINPSGRRGTFTFDGAKRVSFDLPLTGGSGPHVTRMNANRVADWYAALGINCTRPPKIVLGRSNRGKYTRFTETAFISKYDRGGENSAHEFAHHLEYEMNLSTISAKWRDDRAKGERPSHLGSEYDRDEIGVRDSFIGKYVGKKYPHDRATEVLTMGMEYLWNDPVKFMNDDPDHFEYVLDAIRGGMGRPGVHTSTSTPSWMLGGLR